LKSRDNCCITAAAEAKTMEATEKEGTASDATKLCDKKRYLNISTRRASCQFSNVNIRQPGGSGGGIKQQLRRGN